MDHSVIGDRNREAPSGTFMHAFVFRACGSAVWLSLCILAALMLDTQYSCAQTSRPWVTNASHANAVTEGLQGRHLSVWPSHGRYFNWKKNIWEWQRPNLFCTTEDLLSQSIVVPYLVPMLQNAGANVFVPRERDFQREEVIVDNDVAMSGYMERPGEYRWENTPRPGFGFMRGAHHDGDRPFAKGTARMITATQGSNVSRAYYRPNISVSGRYAVYVSYQTIDGSVDDAEYTVVHQGQATKFRVNQRMGSGTWVYLGTFEFDSHSTFSNYVMVSNQSGRRGFVTTDAIRFGGGMGNHERGGRTSDMARSFEAARYWVEYAGAPRAVVVSKGGHDDYGDDINARSLMSNWLSYGSASNPAELQSGGQTAASADTLTLAEAAAKAYLDSISATNPDSLTLALADSMANVIADSIARIPFQHINVINGRAMTGRVPFDLQIGFHTDAGWTRDFSTTFGTLSICTSQFNSSRLAAGGPRRQSFDLACDLLYSVSRDMKKRFGSWETREVWDRNYSETRLPAQPSCILEMLSHENFPDMRLAHDPYFKFSMARSIYATILKYLTRVDGKKAVVQPLPPVGFKADNLRANVLTLSWRHQDDALEPTARATSYNVYMRAGDRGYDNGRNVKSETYTVALQANRIYRFRVTAVNAGGESFPTEELVAMYNPEADQTVLVVNAFHRLSSPSVIDNDTVCGFDLNDDIGLSYGRTAVWVGRQVEFAKSKAGRYAGLGHSDSSLQGRYFAGNDFNYAYSHADAISKAGKFNIISMSSEAIDTVAPVPRAALVDVILGNEKNDGHSLRPYKTFTASLRNLVSRVRSNHTALFLSGSYVASDMLSETDSLWLADNIGIRYGGTDRDSIALYENAARDMIYLENDTVEVYRHIDEQHYASVSSDIILPVDSDMVQQMPSALRMSYPTGSPASVYADDGKGRMYVIGFPFECIKHQGARRRVMKNIVKALLQ